MDTEAFQVFSACLALTTLVVAVASIGALVVGPRRAWSRSLLSVIVDFGPWSVFVVTFGSMVGSLYFSEIANFAPCKLCWYQRIPMYSLAIVSFVAALRRDRKAMTYLAVLGSVGLLVSMYHYLVEWFPGLETNVCSADVPCTAVWFREFGFISLSFMAGTSFLATIVWSIVNLRTGMMKTESN